MSLNEKSDKLIECYIRAGENSEIYTKGVILEPMYVGYDSIAMGYNSGDGYIHINSLVVEEASTLGQVLDSANYIKPEYDPQGYYEQSIECDARDFAIDILKSYTENMNLN